VGPPGGDELPLGPPLSSRKKICPGPEGDSEPWRCSDASEPPWDAVLEPADQLLSRRNKPITDAALGCSMPPAKQAKAVMNTRTNISAISFLSL